MICDETKLSHTHKLPMSYILPSHPFLSVPDPLSICEEDAHLAEVPKWKLISNLLLRSPQPWGSVSVLIDVITSLQPAFSDLTTLRAALNTGGRTEEEFLRHTIPSIVSLALRMPSLFPTGEIPVLEPGIAGIVVLSREQVACLLAHMFLCTLQPAPWNLHWANFHIWYESSSHPVLAYLQSLLVYFEQLDSSGCPPFPEESVSFHRRVLLEAPDWANSQSKLAQITSSHSLDPLSNIEVAFANKDVGFGVSGTQEEAKLAQSPESCVVMLLAPTLSDNEALIIQGVRKIAKFVGVGRDIQCTGVWPLQGPWRDRVIIAMDAVELDVWEGEEEECPIRELNPSVVRRELAKAYCGFYAANELCSNTSCPLKVSTGHWGCGAFGGNKEAKALIQVKKYFFSNLLYPGLIFFQELSYSLCACTRNW